MQDQLNTFLFIILKGDSIILTVEFDCSQEPYLFQTASFSCPSSHQGVAFLQKTLCDVKSVEVEYGVRLCASSIEPFIFKLPRVKVRLNNLCEDFKYILYSLSKKVEYFQDDLFPQTLKWWEAAMTSSEWLSGVNKIQDKLSLCPSGMKPCKSDSKLVLPYLTIITVSISTQ